MPTLYETIRSWKEAQHKLNQKDPQLYAVHQSLIDRLVQRLQRHKSLADLAAGYYNDGDWWRAVVREFSVADDSLEPEALRDAAYYQRLIELRRPGGR